MQIRRTTQLNRVPLIPHTLPLSVIEVDVRVVRVVASTNRLLLLREERLLLPLLVGRRQEVSLQGTSQS